MTKLSRPAIVAKEIRKTLKQEFADTKFRVVTKTYSMGENITISWNDGPTKEDVNQIVEKFEAGKFDGMTDSYDYKKDVDHDMTVKFIFLERTLTENDESIESNVDEVEDTTMKTEHIKESENITNDNDYKDEIVESNINVIELPKPTESSLEDELQRLVNIYGKFEVSSELAFIQEEIANSK